jgi:hypothetical protein
MRRASPTVAILALALGLARGGPSRAQFPPDGQLPDLARQIAVQANELVTTAGYELGGTPQGRRVQISGNALIGAAERFEAATRIPIGAEGLVQAQLQDLDRTYQQVQRDLNSPPGSAPRSAWNARQIGDLLLAIRAPIAPGPIPPGGGGPVLPLIDQLSAQIGQLCRAIQVQTGGVYPYDAIDRDLQAVGAQVLGLRGLALAGQPPAAMGPNFYPVRNGLRQAGLMLESSRPPGPVLVAWRGLSATANQLVGHLACP